LIKGLHDYAETLIDTDRFDKYASIQKEIFRLKTLLDSLLKDKISLLNTEFEQQYWIVQSKLNFME
ncbi:MAG: hypothetical protein AAF634_15775, partial [Bacteroidota bacterium]